MVNMGRIHRELGKFFMISSNLIKSDDKSMSKIGENGIYERELQDDSMESKIIEFDFDFTEKLKGYFLKSGRMKLTKISTKLS